MDKHIPNTFVKPTQLELNEWISKELQDKPQHHTIVKAGEILTISSIYTAAKVETQLAPLVASRINFIEVPIESNTLVESNKYILYKLKMGINGLIFNIINNTISQEELTILFENVRLDYIHTIFKSSDGQAIEQITNFLSSYPHPIAPLQVAIDSNELNVSPYCKIKYISDSHFFEEASAILNTIKHNEEYKTTYFILETSQDYFWDIAKVRAFKTIVLSLINKYFSNEKALFIGHSKNLIKEESETNILKHTASAMASLIATCDGVILDAYKNNSEIAERISNNIFNIIEEESYINTVNDIAHGSYYIENYSYEIATKIFNKLM